MSDGRLNNDTTQQCEEKVVKHATYNKGANYHYRCLTF